jgi:hypothetical protein
MLVQDEMLDNWSEIYLETMEELHGGWEGIGIQTKEEVNEEWCKCFASDYEIRTLLRNILYRKAA